MATLLGEPFALHPPGDYVSDVIRLSGEWYEQPVLEAIRERLESGPAGVLVDVGAMIGTHSCYLAGLARHTEIRAFEPSPANLPLLLANAARWPTVHVHPLALSDREHLVRLQLDPENRGHTRVAERPDPGADWIEAPATTLDAFRLEEVRLVKIDVEGHENEVLWGAERTIRRWHPMLVLESWAGAPWVPPGYELAAEWERAHQTFLYEWRGRAVG